MTNNATVTRDSLVGKRILIIEDEPSISRVYKKWLTKFSVDVIVANNGALGLEQLTVEPVDLILLDLGMPGLDGYETLKRLRSDPNTAAVPVVILSNTTMQKGREGFDAIVALGIEGVWRKYEMSLDNLVDQIAEILKVKINQTSL